MTGAPAAKRPNILLIMCDQYRFPRFSGPEGGFPPELDNILGFQGEVDDQNPFAKFFPGLIRLRRDAVVLRNHTIAASACTPSRAVMFTGQYGTRTGVTQTDGMFKSGDEPGFQWLKADGIPTLGDWMRGAGYSTHYFGKWHLHHSSSSLQSYGFSNWETSYPDPHGASANNLGVYRDFGFADEACTFLNRRGLALNNNFATAKGENLNDSQGTALEDQTEKPWLAVVSFTNPHDIATYPTVIAQALPSDADPVTLPSGMTAPAPKTQSIFGPLTVPAQGDLSPPPANGTMQVPLNPLGFSQDCATASPTQDEDLTGKPACQFDYSYKMGLCLSAVSAYGALAMVGQDQDVQAGIDLTLRFSIPFNLYPEQAEASLQFLQLYGWLFSVVDPHIERVLKTLEESGQADNTIVIFVSDHGELGAAHGMMLEKWHMAYQEAVHVPMVVQLPKDRSSDGSTRQVDAVTSHADIVPTILGLAGVGPLQREKIARELSKTHDPVPPLPGADLAPLLRGETDTVTEPDGSSRQGVLYITDDEITEPMPDGQVTNPSGYENYELFKAVVDSVIAGSDGKGPVPDLKPGGVCQPNHVRCVRTETAKLSRYFDPSGGAPDQWELYDLAKDPTEAVNLVQVGETPPMARDDLPDWTTTAEVQGMADSLYALLEDLEERYLSAVPAHLPAS